MPSNIPICESCGFRNLSKVYAPVEIEPMRTAQTGFRLGGATAKLDQKIMIVVDHVDNAAMFTKHAVSASSGTGKAIFDLIHGSGLHPSNFIVTSLLHCAPPFKAKPMMPSVTYCRDTHLIDELKRHNPSIIIAMGELSAGVLTGLWGGRKEKKTLDDIRGYAHWLDVEGFRHIQVIPTYSPAQIAGDYTLYRGIARRDFDFAIAVAKGEVNLDPPVRYAVGSLTDFDALIEHAKVTPSTVVSFDIETEESEAELEEELDTVAKKTKITSIQLSIEEGTGWFFFWTPEIKEAFKHLLTIAPKQVKFIGHYIWNFDCKVLLESEGIEIDANRTDDTLAMYWHYNPELTNTLGFIGSQFGMTRAWKHTIHDELVQYGCKDVDATLRIYNRLKPKMQAMKASNGVSLWDGYDRFVRPIREILRKAELRGVPRNLEAMNELSKLIKVEQKTALEEIKQGTPKEILPIKPYTNWPDDLKPVIQPVKEAIHRALIKFEAMDAERHNRRVKKVKPPVIKPNHVANLLPLPAPYEWENGKLIRREEFKPLATAHLKRYFTHFGLEIPLSVKGKETTGKTEVNKVLDRIESILYKDTYSELTPADKKIFSAPINAKNFEFVQLRLKQNADFINQIFAYRKYKKADTTYVTGKGWTPDERGRIHTTFLLSGTPTGQLATRRPNIQNLTKGKDANDVIGTKLGKMLRKTLWAEPGHAIMEFDFSGCHILTMGELAQDPQYVRLGKLDAHSFLTSHMVKGMLDSNPAALMMYAKDQEPMEFLAGVRTHLEDLDNWLDYDDGVLMNKLKFIKARFKSIRDAQAKPCIAEDSLVLTQKGLIPIQNITLDHLVWDGLEWVSHSGLIYKGEKEIIEYDGIRATPDHIVYTTDGRAIPIERAASELVRLETTGNGRQAIRTTKNYFRRNSSERGERASSSSVQVCSMWARNLGGSLLVATSYRGWMQTMQQTLFKACKNTWTTLRCYNSTLLQSKRSIISALWRTWNHLQLRLAPAICAVGGRKSTTCELSWNRDRSNRQQRELRTWELATCNPSRESYEYTKEFVDAVSRRKDFNRYFPQSLREILHTAVSSFWKIGRRDYCTSKVSRRTQSQGLENYTTASRRVRVYDIANAGPRHRFTVNNKLVSNCILGNQLGLGASKLYFLNDKTFKDKNEARELQRLLKRLFPKVAEFQDHIKRLAHEQGYLISRHGFIRYFTDVLRWEPETRSWVNGANAEKAIAFYVQNGAFGIIREAMIKMEAQGLLDRFEFNNSVHDSLVFHPRLEDIDNCARLISGIMEEPSEYIVSPAFPGGLQLKVEASIGPNWADIEEIHVPREGEINWPKWIKELL